MAEVLTRQDNYPDIHRGDGVRWSCFQIWKLTLGCADCGYRKHPDALESRPRAGAMCYLRTKAVQHGGGTGYGLPEFIDELQKLRWCAPTVTASEPGSASGRLRWCPRPSRMAAGRKCPGMN